MTIQTATRPAGGVAARVALTLIGAAGLIVGSFLHWFTDSGVKSTKIPVKIFWSTNIQSANASFVASAGFVTIVIGLIALLGLAARTGALTRLAGVLGIVAFVLFVITLYRVKQPNLTIGDVGVGMWIILAGGVVALVAGFFGSRSVVMTSARAPAVGTTPAGPPPPAPPA
jgi:hypothetical protein